MTQDLVSRCLFCGRNWVRMHNYCPKNHKYDDNISLNDWLLVLREEVSRD